MLKRNLAMLIASGLLGAQFALAAAGQGIFPSSAPESGAPLLPATIKYFEQQAARTQAADRTVKVDASTNYINVEHEALVKIENAKGQSFVWKADTLGEANLPLQQVAPRDFAAGQTRIFVSHPYAHLRTD